MAKAPWDRDFMRRGVCYAPVAALVGGPIAALGGILGGGKTPSQPTPAPQPATPTVDRAAVSVQQQEQSDKAAAQKKGAIATLVNTGNTQTGDQLGAGAPETTLKRFLGN
jgi:hypothetical protein